MKTPLFSALALAMAIPTVSATPAAAQTAQQQHRERIADIRAECRDDRLRAMNARQRERARRECQRDLRQARRDWRQYRQYDYNRYEPGANGYYADQYYRDGRYYQERRLSRNDRIYRGQNGQYYCRRPDGTTGLIVGGAAGALLGNALTNGRSSLLGTLIGGGVGAALGREVERGSVRCR
jgi:hypothetical protein